MVELVVRLNEVVEVDLRSLLGGCQRTSENSLHILYSIQSVLSRAYLHFFRKKFEIHQIVHGNHIKTTCIMLFGAYVIDFKLRVLFSVM